MAEGEINIDNLIQRLLEGKRYFGKPTNKLTIQTTDLPTSRQTDKQIGHSKLVATLII